MNDYTWVEEIPTSQLSNRALVLVSQFSRTLKKTNGRYLNLQDPYLAASLVREFRLTENAELHSLFNVLLGEFHLAAELKKKPPLNRKILAMKGGRGIFRAVSTQVTK